MLCSSRPAGAAYGRGRRQYTDRTLNGEPIHRVEITFLCTLTGSLELTGGNNEDPEQLGLEWVALEETLTRDTLDRDYRERIAALEGPYARGAEYLGHHE